MTEQTSLATLSIASEAALPFLFTLESALLRVLLRAAARLW
jgi:hypothetical protein